MKWLKNIEDFTEHILSNKERASERHLNQKTDEKPREVFDTVYQLIANELETAGFKYYPSQHKLKLESKDKSHTLLIKFSSNRDNIAGQYIELSVVFYIESKELKKFSKSNSLLNYSSETIIGRDFGTIVKGGDGNLVWNLADKEEYESALLIIPKTTKETLIDIFEDLQNSELVINEIEKDNFELNSTISTVQYLLMHNQKNIAEKYLSTFFTRKPDKVLDDYKKAIGEFEKDGIPKEFIHGIGYGHEIALIEEVYNLRITMPNNGYN